MKTICVGLLIITPLFVIITQAQAQYLFPGFNAGPAGITFVEAVGCNSGNGINNAFNCTVSSSSINDFFIVQVQEAFRGGADCSLITSTDNKSNTYTTEWAVGLTFQTCGNLYSLRDPSGGVTTITITLNATIKDGSANVLHFRGVSSGTHDQISAPTTTSQGTPWASSSVTTTQATEVLIGATYTNLTTFNSGIQNALLTTATGWNNGETQCAGSNSSPCDTGSTLNWDGANGAINGSFYSTVSSTGSYATGGTNNGSTNVYANFLGIVTFH